MNTQDQLIKKLLEEAGMEGSRTVVGSKYEATLANSAASDPLQDDALVMYRSIIGGLVYTATRSKPNLLVQTSMLAFYLQKSTKHHIVSAKRVPQYLNGTEIRKRNLKPAESNQLPCLLMHVRQTHSRKIEEASLECW